MHVWLGVGVITSLSFTLLVAVMQSVFRVHVLASIVWEHKGEKL